MTTILDVPGSSPPNPFTTPIQALVTTNLSSAPVPALDETAAYLVTSITTSPDPAHALWMLWDAFFTAVVTSSTSHDPRLALLDALRVQLPTQPNNVPSRSDAERRLRSYTGADGKLQWQTLPRFGAQWRDVHDILEAWRDWDGVRESSAKDNSTAITLINSGDKYFLRFCGFSAALLKATKGKSEGASYMGLVCMPRCAGEPGTPVRPTKSAQDDTGADVGAGCSSSSDLDTGWGPGTMGGGSRGAAASLGSGVRLQDGTMAER
ncbi:uncharacterized protein N7515_009412 [Penicillium bovifimosum]|uniref:Uncharacterized protein n=1 Tax=Penicillium bovifimosum TaxID=126998 RepID=A0A9W9GJN0_9EURO|nr:uncharacterized protein N7515_009412 [Penicillium bovifimosum]KAJ5121451.1 hypothetical protein N7515_009412 [Penicillium bovifimosum]